MELKYNISQLGLISAYLFKNAEKCYEFLEEKKYIKKLEDMNQLGVIPNTNIKTSHKRMEYVVLQIFILNLLKGRPLNINSKNKKKQYNLGLSNNDKIGKYTVSGMDLISIWILLFNSGHLIGTFASEKGLLKSIKKNKKLFNLFKSNMPNELKDSFKILIEYNNLYDLHKFLIVFSLNVHFKQAKKQKNKEFIKFLIKCCQKYFLDNDDRTSNLKNIFNKVRQISYLFLDSQYSAFPINFLITPMLLNLDKYIDEIFEENSYFNRTLHSLDDLLAHNIYYSKESIDEFNLYSNEYFSYFNNNRILENKIKNEIINNKQHLKLRKINKKDSIHMFLEFNELFTRFYENPINTNLEIRLNEILPENCLLTIENNEKFRFIVMNVIFISGNYYNHMITISKLTKELIEVKKELFNQYSPNNDETEISEKIKEFISITLNQGFSNTFKEILLFILNNITENHYFKFVDSYENTQIISPLNEEHLGLSFKNVINESKLQSVKYEKIFIKSICEELYHHSSTMLVSLSSIKGYLNKTDELNVEIDGLIFMYKRHKLHLYIIESKNQAKKSYSTAKNDLSIKLNKLNIQYQSIEYKCHNNLKGAYCHLILK